jgi:hypothetical protein
MVRLRLAGPLAAVLVALAAPALASFHLQRIVEVYGGDASHPDAQYLVLEACADFQNLVSGHPVVFYDAAGSEIGSATFAADLPDTSTNQRKVLIASSSAEVAFGVTADLRAPAALLAAGGKLCFDPSFPLHGVDCFAWGGYTALPDPAVGNPWEPVNGLPPGSAAARNLALGGGTTTLECSAPPTGDDSDDSAADFLTAAPAPTNYAGDVGALDLNLVFLHGFETGTTDGWSAVAP